MIDVGYAQFSLSGNVALAPSVGQVNLGQQKVDVQDDLGLDQATGSPYGRLQVDLGLPNLSLSGFAFEDEGRGTLQANFGDIMVGTPVETKVDALNFKGTLTFDLLDMKIVRLSPGVAIDYFDLTIDVNATGLATQEQLDAHAPIPLLFAQGEVDLKYASLLVEAGWINADLGDAKGTCIDVEAQLRVFIGQGFHVFGAYRYINLDADGKADGQAFVGDITLQGWMIGGGYRF